MCMYVCCIEYCYKTVRQYLSQSSIQMHVFSLGFLQVFKGGQKASVKVMGDGLSQRRQESCEK